MPRSGQQVAACVAVALLLLMVFVMWRQAVSAAVSADATRCLIVQMAEHRIVNRAAHMADAKVHGYSYETPSQGVPPRPYADDLATLCEPFLTHRPQN